MNVTQVPATVVVCMTVPDDEPIAKPEGVAPGLEFWLGDGLGVGLLLASGAGTALGAVEQVITTVTTGFGFGVGVVFPIGAAVPLDSAGLAKGATELDGAWLGLMIGDWLGFVGVVRLGGVMLL